MPEFSYLRSRCSTLFRWLKSVLEYLENKRCFGFMGVDISRYSPQNTATCKGGTTVDIEEFFEGGIQ